MDSVAMMVPKLFLLPLAIFFALVGENANAQLVHEVKTGLGISFLGSGDVYVVKLEGEAAHRLNRYFSGSLAVGAGYGDSQ